VVTGTRDVDQAGSEPAPEVATVVDQIALPELDPNLLARAAALAAQGSRRLLGVCGPPGSGKSTLAQALVQALGGRAIVVPMDGFHLAQAELERLGRAQRKGAPDTFDVDGFITLLDRLRGQHPGERDIYTPHFDRTLEESIAGAVAVPAEVPLVVVEGNYLLHDDGPWGHVASRLDVTWYLNLPDDVRVERLVARHITHGRSPEAAREWVLRSDEANARTIAAGRQRASLVVEMP
jgi:pantothenate kinase